MTITVVGGIYRIVEPRFVVNEMSDGDICILVRDDDDGVPVFYSDKWSGKHCISIDRVEFLGIFI